MAGAIEQSNMKKIILGTVIGAALTFGGYAVAEGVSAIQIVESNSAANIEKFYDSDSDVICYTLKIGTFGVNYFQSSMSGSVGISCLKNI